MNISSNILKLQGKAELPREVEIGHNYHLSLEGSIVSKTVSDNDDGSATQTFTFKPVKLDLLDEKGESLRLKDGRSKSQLLRGRLYKCWLNSGSGLDKDTYYERVMDGIIRYAEEISEMYGPEKK